MAFQILLSVDKTRLSVAPGASVELVVTVQNLTTLLDQVAVRLEGIDPAWVEVIPRHLPVFEQGQATARVIIRPPRDPAQALAGTYPIRVRATSQESPGQEGEAATELQVQLVGDYQLVLGRGESRDTQEASYPILVQNGANAPLQLRFSGSDPEDALWYKFDPFQLVVPPGSQASATLTVKAKRAAAEERSLTFHLATQGDYLFKGDVRTAAAPRQTSGTFRQRPAARLTVSVHPPEIEDAERAEFQVRIGNPGLAPVTVRLAGADASGNLDFHFEPVQLTLAPQSDARARLVVRARTRPEPGQRRVNVFRVTAMPIDGEAQPVSVEPRLVQVGPAPAPAVRKGIPWWVIAIILGLIGLCLVITLIAMLLVQTGSIRL